jgi:hypothetical protein
MEYSNRTMNNVNSSIKINKTLCIPLYNIVNNNIISKQKLKPIFCSSGYIPKDTWYTMRITSCIVGCKNVTYAIQSGLLFLTGFYTIVFSIIPSDSTSTYDMDISVDSIDGYTSLEDGENVTSLDTLVPYEFNNAILECSIRPHQLDSKSINGNVKVQV